MTRPTGGGFHIKGHWLALAIAITLCRCGGPTSHTSRGEEDARAASLFDHKRSQCYGLINGKLTNEFQEVILLARRQGSRIVSRCTGTFVSPTTVLTAAHCVSESTSGNVVAFIEDCSGGEDLNIVESTAVYHHGHAANDFAQAQASGDFAKQAKLFNLDLAILVFPEASSKEYRSVASKPTKIDDEVVLVGFGVAYSEDHAKAIEEVAFRDIKKRDGKNTISKEAMDLAEGSNNIGILTYRNQVLESSPGTYSNITLGDSGGPLILDDKLVGVASSGTIATVDGDTVDVGFFTDLHSKESRQLLTHAFEQGVAIEGIEDYLSGGRLD